MGMKQPTSRIIYNYWNDVRGDRLAPHRFDIEPSRMGSVLSETFILERTDQLTFRFRLAGTRLCENFGQELRDQNLTDFSHEERHVFLKAMQAVTAEGAVAVLEIEAVTDDERAVCFEAIVMPLIHTAGTVTRYLGAMSPIDPPAWLGSKRLEAAGLVGHEVVWPEGRPHAMLASAERQTPFAPEMAAARIVRHHRRQFRILDGGRK
jgi:hypothetical protein